MRVQRGQAHIYSSGSFPYIDHIARIARPEVDARHDILAVHGERAAVFFAELHGIAVAVLSEKVVYDNIFRAVDVTPKS